MTGFDFEPKARIGINLPPRQRMCGRCRGSGNEPGMGEEMCKPCVGTGRDLKSDCAAEPCRTCYRRDGSISPIIDLNDAVHRVIQTCNGRGRVTYCRLGRCGGCNGTGWVNY